MRISRVLLTLLAVFSLTTGYCQDITKFGIDIGTYVAIDSASPKGYSVESDFATITVVDISGGSVTIDIKNKTNEMLYASYNDSYYIINGSTVDLLPGNTYLKDANFEVKDDKIAPSTNLKVSLFTRRHNDVFNPIFSNGRAHRMYKENGVGVSESLIVVVKDGAGNKADHKFVFDVSPLKMVIDYKKYIKKSRKNKK